MHSVWRRCAKTCHSHLRRNLQLPSAPRDRTAPNVQRCDGGQQHSWREGCAHLALWHIPRWRLGIRLRVHVYHRRRLIAPLLTACHGRTPRCTGMSVRAHMGGARSGKHTPRLGAVCSGCALATGQVASHVPRAVAWARAKSSSRNARRTPHERAADNGHAAMPTD